jgi:hypothetical protein
MPNGIGAVPESIAFSKLKLFVALLFKNLVFNHLDLPLLGLVY